MRATRHEAVLSFCAFALFGACARFSPDAAPAADTKVIAPASVNAAPARAPSSASVQAIAVEPDPAPSAAASGSTPIVAKKKAARPRTESDCKTCNGVWGTHGISDTASCNCRTSDAGKRCRDGLECEGQCTAAETPERDVTQAGSPPRGFWVGKCSEFVAVFGCYRPIGDGAGARAVELEEPPQTICAD